MGMDLIQIFNYLSQGKSRKDFLWTRGIWILPSGFVSPTPFGFRYVWYDGVDPSLVGLVLDGAVLGAFVSKVPDEVSVLDLTKSDRGVVLVLETPSGVIEGGFPLLSELESIPQEVLSLVESIRGRETIFYKGLSEQSSMAFSCLGASLQYPILTNACFWFDEGVLLACNGYSAFKGTLVGGSGQLLVSRLVIEDCRRFGMVGVGFGEGYAWFTDSELFCYSLFKPTVGEYPADKVLSLFEGAWEEVPLGKDLFPLIRTCSSVLDRMEEVIKVEIVDGSLKLVAESGEGFVLASRKVQTDRTLSFLVEAKVLLDLVSLGFSSFVDQSVTRLLFRGETFSYVTALPCED